jgi:hypothetical protein
MLHFHRVAVPIIHDDDEERSLNLSFAKGESAKSKYLH